MSNKIIVFKRLIPLILFANFEVKRKKKKNVFLNMSYKFIRHSLLSPGIHFRVRLLYFVFLKRLKLFNRNEKLLLLAVREKVPRL
jgi:hypothetical protein